MLIGGDGGGPAWTGSIQVCPGSLGASSPAFAAAGNQVLESFASVFPWNDAGGTGITDPSAGHAWSRLVTVWSADLQNPVERPDRAERAPVRGRQFLPGHRRRRDGLRGGQVTRRGPRC